MPFCTVNVQNDTGACAGYLPIWGQKDGLHVILYGKRTYCNPAAEGANPVVKRMHSMPFCTFTVQNTLFAPVQNLRVQHMHEIVCWEACALTFTLSLNKIIFGAPTRLSSIFLVSCVLVHCLGMGAWLSNIVWVSCRRCPITFVCVCFLSAYPAIFMLSSQNSCILFSSCIM